MGLRDKLSLGARVRRTTNQAITTATFTAISWDTEDFDDANFWDAGAPTVFTIPTSGLYLVTVAGDFDQASGGNFRVCKIRRTTSGPTTTDIAIGGQSGTSFVATGAPRFSATAIGKFLAGDTIDAQVYQDRGSNLNVLGASDVVNFAIAKL